MPENDIEILGKKNFSPNKSLKEIFDEIDNWKNPFEKPIKLTYAPKPLASGEKKIELIEVSPKPDIELKTFIPKNELELNISELIKPVDKIPPLNWFPLGLGGSVLEGLQKGFMKIPDKKKCETIVDEDNKIIFYCFPKTLHGKDYKKAAKAFGEELGKTIWKEGLWPKIKPNLWPWIKDHPVSATIAISTAAAAAGGYIFYQYNKGEIKLGLGVVDFKYDRETDKIDFGFNFSIHGFDIEFSSAKWDIQKIKTIRGRDFHSTEKLRKLWDKIEPLELKIEIEYKVKF